MATGQELLSSQPAIQVRVLKGIAEFTETLDVQRAVWGFADVDLVPPRIQSVARYIGGLLLGAYHGDRMVGFSLSFPGIKASGKGYWHSHMTAVLPSYQNQGIGRRIKLCQRQEAMRAGVGLVEWMFDPLEIRNAYFNVEGLGVIIRGYLPNQYGITSSHLHGALPTDRLVAEWHVNSPRVKAIVDRGEKIEKSVDATIQIPAQAAALRASDADTARTIQTGVREDFQRLLAQNLAVIGYRRTGADGVFELGRLENQSVCALG